VKVVVLLALTFATGGWGGAAHNRLTKSAPETDAVLTAAPDQVRLWFAEKPSVPLSSITLAGPGDAKVPLGKVRATDDPLSIAAAITGALPPGTYTVSWKTSGDDGHVIRGTFRFTFRP